MKLQEINFFASFMQFFLFLIFYSFHCIYPKEIHAYSLVYPVENFSVAFLMGISIAVVQEFKAFSDGIRILQEFQSEKQMADYYDCFNRYLDNRHTVIVYEENMIKKFKKYW